MRKLIGKLLALPLPLIALSAYAADATPTAGDATQTAAPATTASTVPTPSSTSNTTTTNETQRGQEQLDEVMVSATRII